MGHKQSKTEEPEPQQKQRTNNQKGPRNNNNQNLYMVVPYHQGLSERVKKTCSKYGYRYISKKDRPSKASLWLPRTMIPLTARVESYIDTNAMNKGVEKNTLENLAEPLQKGSKSMKSPLPQYLTIVTPQVTNQYQQIYHSGKGRPESHKHNKRGNTYKGQ